VCRAERRSAGARVHPPNSAVASRADLARADAPAPPTSPFLSTHLLPPLCYVVGHAVPAYLPIAHELACDAERTGHRRGRDAILEPLTTEDRSGL